MEHSLQFAIRGELRYDRADIVRRRAKAVGQCNKQTPKRSETRCAAQT